MRIPVRAIAISAVLFFLASPSAVYASYTSTVTGSTATMTGDSAGDTLTITASGGLFSHNRSGLDPNFNSPNDFDTGMAGDQTVSSTTGIININAGDGNDIISLGDGVNLRGVIDGGIGTDTIDYTAYTIAIAANLGLSTTGLSATLGGNQENPATTHTGTGTATVSNYNVVTKTFDISVTVSDLPPGDVIGFHIHQERTNVNGPIIVNFPSGGDPALVPSGTGFTFNATGLVLPSSSEAAFLGGGTYVNIHTALFPGGAIRGQLFSSANTNLSSGIATGFTSVTNIEQVTGGSGNDSLVGNFNPNTLNGGGGVDWMLGGPGGDTFNGDAGDDVMIWSNGDGTDLMDGGAGTDSVQVNGSTTADDIFIIGANATRIDFDRTSPGPFSLDIGTTEILIVNGLAGNDSITVNNLAGIAGLGILHANGFDGNDSIAYTPSNLAAVSFFPNGHLGTDTIDLTGSATAIRANLGLSTTGLSAVLGGDQEGPATTHTGTGTATVSNYNVATRTFDVSVTVTDLPPGDVIGFHIHQERVGRNGPIIVDFGTGSLVAAGTGFTFNATGLVLPETSEAAFLGGGTYVNVHTPTFPGGAIRGQLFSTANNTVSTTVVTGAASFLGFESVTGGNGDDSIVGNSAANALNGGDGIDWILGGPGNDTFGGGAGNDILIWSNGDGSDIMEGGSDADTIQVNGNVSSADTFVVNPNGTRVNFARTNPGPFALDIGTTETLIVNGIAGDDIVTVNSLTGVAALTAVNLHGLAGNDTFNVTTSTTVTTAVIGGQGNDTLTYDAQSRVATGDLTPPDGQVDSPGLRSVPFFNTETINVLNPAPTILISDVTISEVASPPTAVFNVTLSAPSPLTVTVNFATADGTAAAPGDYTSQSNTLTFVPGDTSEPISITVNADMLAEAAETFFVNLTGAGNATIADSQGQATITDNAPPTITDIGNQITNEDTATAALAFTIGDAETAIGSLTLSGSSSNPTIVPNGNIVFGGSGASRTVTVTPALDQNGGPVIITVTVNDGVLNTSDTFDLTVTAVNDAPRISGIPNQVIPANSSTGPLPFVISDVETAAASLTVSAMSSDPVLVSPSGFQFGGSGGNRTLNVTPNANTSGTAIITVTVNDGAAGVPTTFMLTVDAPSTPPPPPPPPAPPANAPPTLTGLGNQTIDENGAVTVTLTVGDDATAPGNLSLSASSSNAALIPPGGLLLGGAGATRTLTITPVLDAAGQSTVSVTVSDGALATTQTATVTVVAATAATPLLPPLNLISSIIGGDVLLSWTPPATGGRPSFYVIEGGTAPGASTIPVLITPAPGTSLRMPLAPGTYFFRARSGNRAGTSAVSNEVTVVISTLNVPGAPQGLQVGVVGTRVTVSWQRPATGGEATSWLIELDTTPTPGDIRTFRVPASVFSVSGDLARGEYVARVRGENSAGQGPPSNAPRFTVDLPGGGGCDVPDAPVLLPASVLGRIVTLTWRPPRAGVPVNYRLLVGSLLGGSDLATINVGPVNAFVFNAPPGTYHATIVALNSCGPGVASNSVPVVVTGFGPPPPPSNVRAQVVGSTVTLAWDAAPGAASYVIEAGTAPGATTVVFPLIATTLTVPEVPSGVFFVRVRAIGAGGASLPSAEVVIVVP